MLNPFKDVNWNPGTRERRKFALSLMIGFPAIATIFSLLGWFAKHTWKPFFLWLGLAGFAVGLVFRLLPQISRPFYVIWFFIACCMGIVMGNLVLVVFFFLALTPMGLLMRVFGRTMPRQFDRSCATYWRDVKKNDAPDKYYHQF